MERKLPIKMVQNKRDWLEFSDLNQPVTLILTSNAYSLIMNKHRDICDLRLLNSDKLFGDHKRIKQKYKK